jgi:tungstate transport system substrate-binding protein
MNKRSITLLFVLLIALLAACGGAAPAVEPAPSVETPATAPEPTAVPAATEVAEATAVPAETMANTITLATTTSTEDSGLLDYLLPVFTDETGIDVEVVAVGTGQAIALGETGDADVLLVHARSKEDAYMDAGHGTRREDVMYNDFVIVGPESDPAGISGMTDAAEAFAAIAAAEAPFVSRGDDSGTHTKELAIWEVAGIEPAGDWYISAGQGMGAVLTMADELQAYSLSDRATYLARTLEGTDLDIVVEGDPLIFNPYGVMDVNPNKSADINAEGAMTFIDWITALPAQELISTFGVADFGSPLFVPDSAAWNEANPMAEPELDTQLTLATTTSTQDSGLLDFILPDFTEETGIEVEVVAVGTGQAIALGETGDADVLLVHARSKEDDYMDAGHGTRREDVMYNDFIIVGPESDPAGIAGMTSATEAMAAIAATEAPFVSRGDDSGTHTKELGIWAAAEIEPTGDWYISAGQGMGAVLTMADELQAYTLTDRATYLARTLEGTELIIVVEGDPVLFNPYGIMDVNPDKSPDINAAGAQVFINWIVSLPTQERIAVFGVDEFGSPLFTPDSAAWNEAHSQ